MKKITLLNLSLAMGLFGFLLLPAFSFAQTNFTISPTEGVFTGTVTCDSTGLYHFYVNNPNPKPITLQYVVTENSLPQGTNLSGEDGCWRMQFCDWTFCSTIPAVGDIKSPKEIPADSLKNNMKLDIDPLKIKGSGRVVIKIYEKDFPANFKILTWNITGCTNGSACTFSAPEYSANNLFSVYPNPAQNYITMERISSNNMAIGTVQIFNVVGEMLLQFNEANNTTLKMDITSLSAGAYYVKRSNPVEGTSVKQFFKTK